MKIIKVDTEKMLQDIGVLPLWQHTMFTVPHSDQSKSLKDTSTDIRENIGDAEKKGVYVYFQNEKCLYVGKAASLYTRVRCHYMESIFEPNGETIGIAGDARRGVYPAFFRDTYPGDVRVYCIEIQEEKDREIIEIALRDTLKPKFISFQVERLAEERIRRLERFDYEG